MRLSNDQRQSLYAVIFALLVLAIAVGMGSCAVWAVRLIL